MGPYLLERDLKYGPLLWRWFTLVFFHGLVRIPTSRPMPADHRIYFGKELALRVEGARVRAEHEHVHIGTYEPWSYGLNRVLL